MTEEATLRHNWRNMIESDGGYCPVCDRWGKVNKVKLTGGMARSLAWLVSVSAGAENGWVNTRDNVPLFMLRSNSIGHLKYWGLVQSRAPDSEKVKTSGVWRATLDGHDFVHNRLSVPSHMFVYNDAVMRTGLDFVSIEDCFTEEFDYREVMNSYFPTTQVQDELNNN
jgi:hypothetical protein